MHIGVECQYTLWGYIDILLSRPQAEEKRNLVALRQLNSNLSSKANFARSYIRFASYITS